MPPSGGGTPLRKTAPSPRPNRKRPYVSFKHTLPCRKSACCILVSKKFPRCHPTRARSKPCIILVISCRILGRVTRPPKLTISAQNYVERNSTREGGSRCLFKGEIKVSGVLQLRASVPATYTLYQCTQLPKRNIYQQVQCKKTRT